MLYRTWVDVLIFDQVQLIGSLSESVYVLLYLRMSGIVVSVTMYWVILFQCLTGFSDRPARKLCTLTTNLTAKSLGFLRNPTECRREKTIQLFVILPLHIHMYMYAFLFCSFRPLGYPRYEKHLDRANSLCLGATLRRRTASSPPKALLKLMWVSLFSRAKNVVVSKDAKQQ